MNAFNLESTRREFDATMRLALADAASGRLSHGMLLRLARVREGDTVRFCLDRMSDPSLEEPEEVLLAALLGQTSDVIRAIEQVAARSAAGVVLRAAFPRESNKGIAARSATRIAAEDVPVVVEALDRLDAGAEREALPFLLCLLALDAPNLQSKAAKLIAKLDLGLVYVGRLVRHRIARVRANAVEALVERPAEAVEILKLAAGDPDRRVRSLAALGLCNAGHPLGEALLVAALQHEDPKERRSAVWALTRTGLSGFEQRLEQLAREDPDARVRQLAAAPQGSVACRSAQA